MKLQAKGRDNDFVTLAKVPEEAAAADSRIVMRAFREACEGLLALAMTEDLSETVRKGLITNYIGLKKLHEDMQEEVEGLGVILHVIENKIKAV